MQVMQYGCMDLLRVSGWAAVIVAVPAVLIVGVVAAHRASASSRQPAGDRKTAPAVTPHPAGTGTHRGGQVLATGPVIDPPHISPGACAAFPHVTGNRYLTVVLDAGHSGPVTGRSA